MPLLYVHGLETENAYEVEIKAVLLTYEQALEMAINNMLVIQDMDTQIREMYLELRYMVLDLEARLFDSRPRIVLTDEAITTYTRRLRNRMLEHDRNSGLSADSHIRRSNREILHNLNEFERDIERLRLNRQQAGFEVEQMLRDAIVNVSDIDLRIDVLREELSFAEENLHRIILFHELGFISIQELRDADHDLAQGYTRLDELIRNRYVARQRLNYLLGQPLFQYTVVTFERELTDFSQSVAQLIDNVIYDSPPIHQSQLELDTALGERWIYTGNNNDIRISESERRRARTSVYSGPDITKIRNRISLQDTVERAVLGHEQAIRTMEVAFYRGLTEMEGLLALELAHRQDLAQAQASLDIVHINFDLGHATRLDMAEARLVIFQVEQSIEGILNRMWALSFMLDNPSLLG